MNEIITNAGKPAPRWFRITKRVIYLLTGSSVLTGTFSRVGITDADSLLIVGWMILLGEILNIILTNGEDYIKTETKN